MRVGTRVQLSETLPDQQQRLVGSVGTIIEIITEPDPNDYDGNRIAEATVRWDMGPIQTLSNKDDDGKEWHYWDLEDVTPTVYVNVYLHDKSYGGPQEGGWWYDTYDPQYDECVMARNAEEARTILEQKQAWCDEENTHRNSNISSVASDGRYEVRLEAFPPEPSPTGRPRYC